MYFFSLLFNFQGPIFSLSPVWGDSFVIIALCFAFVNTFFKTFLTFFQVFSSFFRFASLLPCIFPASTVLFSASLEATCALYHFKYCLSILFLNFFQLFSFLSINVYFSIIKAYFLYFFNIWIKCDA